VAVHAFPGSRVKGTGRDRTRQWASLFTDPGRRAAANLMTRDEAHGINFAKLPELLRR
jgi:hypothetical protein